MARSNFHQLWDEPVVDQEGMMHFCEIASRNLSTMSDQKWGVLLARMQLRVIVDETVTVKLALPRSKTKGMRLRCSLLIPQGARYSLIEHLFFILLQ